MLSRILPKHIVCTTAAILVLAAGCAENVDVSTRFERAKTATLASHMDAGARAEAFGDWTILDEEHRSELTDDQARWVDFGIGILTLVDVVQGAGQLLEEARLDNAANTENNTAAEEEPALDLETDVLIDLLAGVRDNFLERQLGQRFVRVAEDPDFNATFDCPPDTLERFDVENCILDGNVDFGDIALLGGSVQLVVTILRHLEEREGLLAFAIDTILNLPEFDPDGANIFRQLPGIVNQVLEDYAQTNYGTDWQSSALFEVGSLAQLQDTKAELLSSLDLMVEGLNSTRDESRNEQETEAFSNKNYLSSFVRNSGLIQAALAEEDAKRILQLLPAADTIVTTDVLADIVGELRNSLGANSAGANGAYFVLTLLQEVGSLIPGGYVDDIPATYFPGIWLGALFTDKFVDPKTLLPASENGVFVAEYEQESYDYDPDQILYASGLKFEDVGIDGATSPTALTDGTARPGAGDKTFNDALGKRSSKNLPPMVHANPNGGVDAANGWVDPIYLFWPDPDFGGLLKPLVENGKNLEVDDGSYENHMLNGFVSVVVAIIEEVSAN